MSALGQETILRVEEKRINVVWYAKLLAYRLYNIDLQASETTDTNSRDAVKSRWAFDMRSLPFVTFEQLVDDVVIESYAAFAGVEELSQEEIDEGLGANLPVVGGLREDVQSPLMHGRVRRQVGLTPSEYRAIVTNEMRRQRLTTRLSADIPSTTDYVRVRAMLSESRETAEMVRGLLVGASPWDDMKVKDAQALTIGAREIELGWVTEGVLGPGMEGVVEALKVGVPSQPVRDILGWWIFWADARKKAARISPEHETLLGSKLLSDWLREKKKGMEISRYLNSRVYAYATHYAKERRRLWLGDVIRMRERG